eukprot:gene3471-2422_t
MVSTTANAIIVEVVWTNLFAYVFRGLIDTCWRTAVWRIGLIVVQALLWWLWLLLLAVVGGSEGLVLDCYILWAEGVCGPLAADYRMMLAWLLGGFGFVNCGDARTLAMRDHAVNSDWLGAFWFGLRPIIWLKDPEYDQECWMLSYCAMCDAAVIGRLNALTCFMAEVGWALPCFSVVLRFSHGSWCLLGLLRDHGSPLPTIRHIWILTLNLGLLLHFGPACVTRHTGFLGVFSLLYKLQFEVFGWNLCSAYIMEWIWQFWWFYGLFSVHEFHIVRLVVVISLR